MRLDVASGTLAGGAAGREGTADDAPDGDWSLDRKWKVYARQGDLYLKNAATGAVRQLTRTAEEEREPRFMVGDGRVSFRRGDAFFVYDLASGLVSQAADVRLEKDPAEEDDPSYLRRPSSSASSTCCARQKRDRDEAREEDRAEQRADPTRPPLPFYLGDKVEIDDAALSRRAATGWCSSRLPSTARRTKAEARSCRSTSPRAATSRSRTCATRWGSSPWPAR